MFSGLLSSVARCNHIIHTVIPVIASLITEVQNKSDCIHTHTRAMHTRLATHTFSAPYAEPKFAVLEVPSVPTCSGYLLALSTTIKHQRHASTVLTEYLTVLGTGETRMESNLQEYQCASVQTKNLLEVRYSNNLSVREARTQT